MTVTCVNPFTGLIQMCTPKYYSLLLLLLWRGLCCPQTQFWRLHRICICCQWTIRKKRTDQWHSWKIQLKRACSVERLTCVRLTVVGCTVIEQQSRLVGFNFLLVSNILWFGNRRYLVGTLLKEAPSHVVSCLVHSTSQAYSWRTLTVRAHIPIATKYPNDVIFLM